MASANPAPLRLNGAQVASAAIATGSTVYRADALYFGSRVGAGAAATVTGDEFVSIVRGGATPSATQIAAVERWTSARMQMSF